MKLNLNKLTKNLIQLAALTLVVVGVSSITPQAIGAISPTGHDKNYEYQLVDNKCQVGDVVEYSNIEPNKDPSKVKGVNHYACIRLKTSDPKGYTLSTLTTNDSSINTCDGSTSHLIHGLGWICVKETDSKLWDTSDLVGIDNANGGESCQSIATGQVTCPGRQSDTASFGSACGSSTTCKITENIINPLINLAAGAVGIIVLIMIIIGGIEYSTAGGDQARVASAKKRIFNAIFALVMFLLLYVILAWTLPGKQL